MTRLLEILISIAIVAALFLVVGLVLPSSRHISESVETNREMTIVYDTLNSLRRFADWHSLVLRDPNVDITLSGPAEGVGARMEYSSDNLRVIHRVKHLKHEGNKGWQVNFELSSESLGNLFHKENDGREE